MTSVALLAITDGRHAYHERALKSALEHLPRFDQYVFVDDPDHRLGFGGAIRAGWEQVRADWVFHFEADFTFNEPPPVGAMIRLLDEFPEIAQVSLKRQPVNEREIAVGGIVEADPDDFTDHLVEYHNGADAWFTTHRRYWTTNPSVYSSQLCRLGWPQEPHSEGVFTHRLLTDPLLQFAIWGRKDDPPMIHHIGDVRSGTGY